MSVAADALLQRLLDVVVSTDLDDPTEDFVSVMPAGFALAISKLPDVCEATFGNWINARTP
jgi:hypothetical protein